MTLDETPIKVSTVFKYLVFAFDLVDHGILAAKILGLRVPRGIARWVCDFLMDRRQRVKLSSDCFSEWGTVP